MGRYIYIYTYSRDVFILSEQEISYFMISFLLNKFTLLRDFISLRVTYKFFCFFFFSVHGLVTEWHYLYELLHSLHLQAKIPNISYHSHS